MSIHVTACLNPFSAEKTEFSFTQGLSVGDIITKIDVLHAVNTGWRVLFNDEPVSDFDRIPEENQHVYIKIVPEGDNRSTGRGMKVAGGVMTALGVVAVATLGWTGIGGFAGAMLIGAGVGMVAGGAVLYNLDIPSLDKKKQPSPEQDPSIRGSRNQSRPYGFVPVLFGRRRIYADLAASSCTWVDPSDGSVYLYQLFCAGQKDMEIDSSSIKIDETLLSDYSASKNISTILSGHDSLIQMQIAYGAETPPLMKKCTHEMQHNSVLKHTTSEGVDGSLIETTPDGTDEINVDIFFYNGLGRYNDEGELKSVSVTVRCYYKRADESDSSYQLLGHFSGGSDTMSGAELKTKRFAITKSHLPPASYTVKVTRVTGDQSDTKIIDEVYVGSIRAIKSEPPVRPERCRQLTLIGLKIKASEKLNNVIDRLNFVATSRLPVPVDGEQRWRISQSANPASAAMYAMQGEPAQQKLSDEEIDIDAMLRLHSWCARHGYSCNAYLTESMTISQLLTSIASTCRAEIIRRNGKITVIQDIERDSPVQLFTPRNSYDYKESIALSDIPDEIKLGFDDADSGYAENSCSVYNTPDGNKNGEPETTQDVALWGVTNSIQARKLGMYKYSVSKHRPLVVTFSADFEYMLCSKGDWIKYAGDIALAGITQGRIFDRFTNGTGNITGFICDEDIQMESGKNYAMRVRRKSGECVLLDVLNSEGVSHTVMLAEPMSYEDAPDIGDLFAFGERGNEAIDLIITDIQCGENLTADVTCVEYAPEIFGVDSPSFVLPEYHNKLTETQSVIDTGEVTGWRTWTTYNDSTDEPNTPTGNGTSDGWHLVQTSEAKWISTKTSVSINEGDWSSPSPMGMFAIEKLKDIVGADTIQIGPPDKPVLSNAKASRDGISVECAKFGTGLANAIKVIDYYIKKGPDAEWAFFAESSSLNAIYSFDRITDHYPEKSDMTGWFVRAKAFNVYNKESEWSNPLAVSVDGYGTWLLSAPAVYPRISDRTITLKLSEPPRSDNSEVYGTVQYRVKVRRPDIDGESIWFKPATSLNPYPVKDYEGNITSGNEENYKDGNGFVISDGTYIQTMPLNGQATNDIRDTGYQFSIVAENEAGISEETVINVTALCTNMQDIVQANEDFKQLYITDLSALSANIGAILEGAFGDGSNLWDLSTFMDKYGVQHYKGRLYVGGTEQYLHVDPVLENGFPTGEYTISFKVGSFEITSEASKVNGEFIVQVDETSLDRTRITPQGTYYEHRSTVESAWITVAKQETRGLLSQILYSEQSLVVSNTTIAERRQLGHDIGRAHISANARVYHFDTDLLDQNKNVGYTMNYIGFPVLVDEKDNNPVDVIDFSPAILTLAPYSEIGKSLYGQYSLTHPLPQMNQWTIDFWIQYIWAENQTLFHIGNETDCISIIISTGEPNYNEYLDDEPPYNYEVTEPDLMVYNVTLGADTYIFHTGIKSEYIKISDLGIRFAPNSWLHFAVVLTTENISVFIGTKRKVFSRYSEALTSSNAIFNAEMNSFCLDELYIDTAEETFEAFVKYSLDKIPWGTLDYAKRHFILDAADLTNFHTNLFDSPIFRQKVLDIINEYHTQGE